MTWWVDDDLLAQRLVRDTPVYPAATDRWAIVPGRRAEAIARNLLG